MAKTVVELADPEDIPQAPISILRDVIHLRKKTSRFFAKIASQSDDKELKGKNTTHEHLVSVLEDILGMFEGVLSQKGCGKESKLSGSVDVKDLNNMFQYLDVEGSQAGSEEDDEEPQETSDTAGQTTTRRKSKKAAKRKKAGSSRQTTSADSQAAAAHTQNPVTPANSDRRNSTNPDFQPWDEEELWMKDQSAVHREVSAVQQLIHHHDYPDLWMIWYCFFEDFNTIRNHVCERWCDYFYADRPVHLKTLAVMTNTAYELFQQMERDLHAVLDPICPRMAEYDYMTQLLVFSETMQHVDYASTSGDPQRGMDYWYDEEGGFLGLSTFFSMRRVIKACYKPTKGSHAGQFLGFPFIQPSARTGIYGSTALSDRVEVLWETQAQLAREVTVIRLVKKLKVVGSRGTLPAESEILLELQRAIETRKVRSSTVFSLQLYSDIRGILERRVEDGFSSIQETGRWVDRTVEAHFRLVVEFGLASDEHLSKLKLLQSDVRRWMLQDMFLIGNKTQHEMLSINEPPLDYQLFKIEPIYTGLLDFRAKLAINELGHVFSRRYQSIEAAAYLYSAARAAAAQSNATLPAWPDMDRFLDTYGEDSPFMAGILQAPVSAVTILENWTKVAAVLANKASGTAWTEAVVGRTLAQHIQMREALAKRYYSGEAAAHRDPVHLMDYCKDLIVHRLEVDDRQHSPLDVLKMVDDSVSSLLDGIMSVDYFKLFGESTALLGAIDKAYDFEGRVFDPCSKLDFYGKIPTLIAGDLKAHAAADNAAGVLTVLVSSVKTYLQEKDQQEEAVDAETV